jgi:hypothetical protein
MISAIEAGRTEVAARLNEGRTKLGDQAHPAAAAGARREDPGQMKLSEASPPAESESASKSSQSQYCTPIHRDASSPSPAFWIAAVREASSMQTCTNSKPTPRAARLALLRATGDSVAGALEDEQAF